LVLTSLEQIGRKLGVTNYKSRNSVDVAIAKMRGGIKIHRAAIYSAYFAQNPRLLQNPTYRPAPMARVTIHKEFHRCKRTQKKYEKIAGIVKQPNATI
jgi:hypothetical protein